MNDINEREQLINAFKAGIFYQTLLLLVEQAFAWDKEETIQALGDTFAKFSLSLSEEEQKEFNQKLRQVMISKGQKFGHELSKTLSPEEFENVKKELDQLASADNLQPQQ